MRKVRYVKAFSSKHNLLAKRWREKFEEEKVRRTTKPKLNFGQKIKLKILKTMLFLVWLAGKIKSIVKK